MPTTVPKLTDDPLFQEMYDVGTGLLQEWDPAQEEARKTRAWGQASQKNAERFARAGLTGSSDELTALGEGAKNFELDWDERADTRKRNALASTLPLTNFMKEAYAQDANLSGVNPYTGTATWDATKWREQAALARELADKQSDSQDAQLIGAVAASLGLPQWLAQQLFGINTTGTGTGTGGIAGQVVNQATSGLVNQGLGWLKDYVGSLFGNAGEVGTIGTQSITGAMLGQNPELAYALAQAGTGVGAGLAGISGALSAADASAVLAGSGGLFTASGAPIAAADLIGMTGTEVGSLLASGAITSGAGITGAGALTGIDAMEAALAAAYGGEAAAGAGAAGALGSVGMVAAPLAMAAMAYMLASSVNDDADERLQATQDASRAKALLAKSGGDPNKIFQAAKTAGVTTKQQGNTKATQELYQDALNVMQLISEGILRQDASGKWTVHQYTMPGEYTNTWIDKLYGAAGYTKNSSDYWNAPPTASGGILSGGTENLAGYSDPYQLLTEYALGLGALPTFDTAATALGRTFKQRQQAALNREIANSFQWQDTGH